MDSHSIEGDMYLGEAQFRQSKWDEALQEFGRAHGEFVRQHRNATERPTFLIARINRQG